MEYLKNKIGLIYSSSSLFVILIIAAMLFSSAAVAENNELEATTSGAYELPLYKSGVIRVDQRVRRISVGNPGIADLLVLRSNEIYAVGKNLGSTNVALWDNQDRIFRSFDIEVTHDLLTLKTKLHELLPDEQIKVHSAQERIILSGAVKTLTSINAAEEIAYSFLPECIASESDAAVIAPEGEQQPIVFRSGGGKRSSGNQECKEGKVINLMQVSGAQQVMLEVKVAEIARTLLRSLETDLNIIHAGSDSVIGAVSGGASFPDAPIPIPLFGGGGGISPIGPVVDVFSPSQPGISDNGVFLSHLGGDTFFQAVIEASRQKGLAKILAEPTVTTLTGQEAKFISGGEFPVPVPRSGTTGVTIEFKEFGVGVKFLPTVLDKDHINLKMNIEVSEISQGNQVVLPLEDTLSTFLVPALTKRGISSTVELRNGQTIGIAGLISDNVRESVDKLPGIGEIPVLGQLFSSQSFISGQTELVIFVTPHLAKPIARDQISLPTDSFVAPNDFEFYVLGRLDAVSAKKDSELLGADMIQPNMDEAKIFGHNF